MTPSSLIEFTIGPLAFIEGLGGPEVILILVIMMLLFGGKKMPELARGLGKSIREFKKATAGVEDEIKRAMAEEPRPTPALPPTATLEPSPTTGAAAATQTRATTEPAAVSEASAAAVGSAPGETEALVSPAGEPVSAATDAPMSVAPSPSSGSPRPLVVP